MQRADGEKRVEQHNLCSEGDYVPQKQMIKVFREKKRQSECLSAEDEDACRTQRENTGSLTQKEHLEFTVCM